MTTNRILLAVAVASLLAGCANTAAGPSPVPSSEQAAPVASESPKDESGTLKESGFGQSQEYLWVTSIVHNNTDKVGQTVTVNFNVYDEKDALIKTESQVESFSRPKADHAVGTHVELQPGEKAARVEATLLVEEPGIGPFAAFPELPVTTPKYSKDYLGQHAVFELSNPSPEPLKEPRLQVVCRNAENSIIGGGSEYPNLVPANGKVRVDATVITSGEPKSCEVFSSAPFDWEGSAMAQATPTALGGPETAFEVYVKQFTAGEFAEQYQTMVSAQQKLISEADYVACRKKQSGAKIKWVKSLGVKDGGTDKIPGTNDSLPSRIVTARVSANGVTVPLDAHVYDEGGVWKWAMTAEALKECLG